ncbi:PREDICTED: DNA polymerase epsilon catalytic subunit A-like [Camelina sativa]|uniref:DNA polymerase epsilon catalytic subunit n=1 Tax=Camelina sativa TaxID=90675 RepID=A0ABM1R7U9_CAMSA|nr:PREDICTED: DNA polymerase epsilon catalytic subunit A-like [Camelina sativa]
MSGDNRRRDRKDSRWSKKPRVVNTAEDELESKLGFGLFSEGETRLGWLLTFASSSWEDRDTGKVYSCVDLYFVTQDGFSFKTKYKFRPYFYLATKDSLELEVEAYLRRRYERQVAGIEIVDKEDLDLKNHLSGLQKKYLKVSFDTVQQLMEVKRDLLHIVERNQAKFDALEAYESILAGKREQHPQDCLDSIVDIREYDVPYHVRFAIDNDVRSGQWYNVSISSTDVILEKRSDLLQRAEVRVCAFDIETTKLPLKFPDAEYDQIMMISYMVDGQGFLITNRECVGEDIEDLEYTPKPEFEGYFKVTNVKDEVELLQKWFSHMQELKPGIYVTYNGDFFDWPFIERRASHHSIKMNEELGFRCDLNQGECRAKFACHLDCFAWVKRDSYLPQGSHGLKAVTKAKLGYDPLEVNPEDMVRFAQEKPQAVTKAKLGYDPLEVNPEDMVRFAQEKPQYTTLRSGHRFQAINWSKLLDFSSLCCSACKTMASYSVSDAVATYYLYMTYVNPFIFSLATIIPMVPDEVLRKGSGTLCEMLLMVEAYKANVVCPNKNQADPEKFYQNQLLESETYIGGHVECLESGVFRSDIPTSFKLDSSAYQQLIDNLGRDLEYAITVEGKMRMDSISNYDEVKDEIKKKTMASYSVSDAVATYYLYMTYVNPFIFSLATIIPMVPDEVLRKGSGTLCEMLLMVQAYKANVVCPNKNQADPEKFYQNQLLESETYIGGHVECLESGVFRSDIPTSFKLDSSAYQQLIDNLGRDLEYAITVEGKMRMDSISNYDEVKDEIKKKLEKLRDDPIREEGPLIYHLDVAAMYPNIILTSRLQPPSIVTDEVCTACDFNRPGKTCLRKLEWVWRGVTFMGKKSDYYHLKKQIESEFVDTGANIQSSKSFLDLPKVEQQTKLKERLKKYCQKAYKRVLDKPITEVREAGICMRENPFYVDTVRSFRDRRYEYKTLNKVWKGKLSEAKASGNSIKIQEAQDMVVVYDSLQLAHKCILNSFYGYVMRKGARWYSMEMAGVVTYTGAKIIQNARLLIDRIGKPLELDTDGIWCCLPGSFPENFTFKTMDMKKLTISYPCVMLNVDVAKNNTNDQYQTLEDPVRKTYKSHSECSIEFEVDGPYKAMIIPASKEEGILIKKRYAVFNHDGTLAELKGFEIKRRGELKLIKVFQAELFDKFLHGSTLKECYSAVAAVANRWLDLLDNQGKDIADSELLDYISESSTMSKSLADYGEQKSCAVTTAKRLAEFLGDSMVKDKGLRCQYIVACEPKGTPVSERAVPVAIFETTKPGIMKYYLRKWCKTSSDVGIRLIIDWSYYKQRLSSAIQKVITIPAAMQKVENPVPRVNHPDWLHKKVREKEDKFRQRKLVDMFSSANKDGVPDTDHLVTEDNMGDIEDFCKENRPSVKGPKPIARSFEVQKKMTEHEQKESWGPEFHDISLQNIDKNVNYQGWLELKKRKWKVTLEKKKKRRLGDLRSSNQIDAHEINQKVGLGGGGVGVGSYFRRPEEALTSSHWQIIQLVPSPQSGQFFAWVVVKGLMLKIPLTIPRVYYINSKAPTVEKFPGKCVNKILPHGRPCYNLIEVKIQEDQFKKESKMRAALLANPEIEGIYETKVPLEFSAICQIGCVCEIDNTAKHRNIQDGWKIGELHMKTTTECRYLDRSIPLVYLYNSTSTGRAIYVLYCHASKRMSAVVVDPFSSKELLPSPLERQFRDSCQEFSIDSLSWGSILFQVDYVDYPEAAKNIIQKAISEYREENSGPTVAVIECPDFNSMKEGIKALDDFPCMRIPFNGDDNSYQPVSWQRPAAKIAMFRCAAAFQWLDRRIAQSRYAHVPLGNFGLDWLTFTIDIFMSRALRGQQQVLWVSDNGVPDLGGINNEETFFADEVRNQMG